MLQKVFTAYFLLLNLHFLVEANNIVTIPDALYYNLTTTKRVDLFIAHNQRQFAAAVRSFEERLVELKHLYNERIQILGFNQDFFEQRLIELENKLNPLELLDDVSDFCVQKYRNKAPVLATIKTNYGNCLQKANAAYPQLVTAPETTIRNLKNYHNNNFVNSLKDCKKKYADMESNHTACVLAAVKTTTGVTNTNTITFNTQMKTAACSGDLKIKEAFDCYAGVLATGLNSITEVVTLVDNCIAGHEFCVSCSEGSSTSKGRCPYQMSWHLAENDISSEKITNPFKGISMSTPCLQINFINKSVELV